MGKNPNESSPTVSREFDGSITVALFAAIVAGMLTQNVLIGAGAGALGYVGTGLLQKKGNKKTN